MRSAAFVALTVLAGCGPHRGDDDDDVQPTDARPSDGPSDAAPGDGTEELPSRVYAHSGQTLYVVDTTTLAQTRIGDFTNLGATSMTDIAVDRDERMIGISFTKIYQIDVHTAASTELAAFGAVRGFSSLSFVPMNPANPDGPEMLIAANDMGAVYRIEINGMTATAVAIGSYGMMGATTIGSSGDIGRRAASAPSPPSTSAPAATTSRGSIPPATGARPSSAPAPASTTSSGSGSGPASCTASSTTASRPTPARSSTSIPPPAPRPCCGPAPSAGSARA